jgi:hypothetical protein
VNTRSKSFSLAQVSTKILVIALLVSVYDGFNCRSRNLELFKICLNRNNFFDMLEQVAWYKSSLLLKIIIVKHTNITTIYNEY